MQNWRLILVIFMVFFVSIVSCSSLLADDGEDLLEAVCRGTNEQVKLWFEKNADRISSGQEGKAFFSSRDKDGWTAVICSAANNDHQSAELLIKAGAEINVKDNLGWTPLMYAADRYKGDKMVSFLLDNGADPNIRNNDGNTALIISVHDVNLPLTILLLESGANPNLANNTGESALDIAKKNNHTEIVKILDPPKK